MSITTPRLEPVVERLSATVSALRKVATAFDLIAAIEQTKVSPCAYVIPLDAGYGDNNAASGIVQQQRTASFGVALLFMGAGPTGTAATAFQSVKDGVLSALIGWRHPDGGSVIVAVREQLVTFDLDRELFGYQITFRHHHQIRQ